MSEETEKRQVGSTAIVWGCSSLVPWCSLLPHCLHEFQERAGDRRPSQYWQNTPGHILQVSTAPFWKTCSPILWMCRLKCLQTAVSHNFVAYFFWLIFCLSWWIVYGQRLCQSATQAKILLDPKQRCKFSPKTYLYIFFDSEWEYDSGESDLDLTSHPLCGHPKGIRFLLFYKQNMFPYGPSAKTNRQKRLKEIGTCTTVQCIYYCYPV